jgi:acyl-coenzyme A thioesterase PaaI-like protein
VKKQKSSRNCFVCGRMNPVGLKAFFYEDDDGRVVSHYSIPENYNGYPGVAHGGIVTALLDEAMGRTAIDREIWLMTAKMTTKFHQPTPTETPLTIIAWITRKRRKVYEVHGEVRLEDGTLTAEADGIYFAVPEEQFGSFDEERPYWRVYGDDE